MTRTRSHSAPIALLAALGLFLGGVLTAEPAHADVEITASTLDGGGGTSSGGAYVVTGTIGQPDAALQGSGGSYAVAGGFWPGADAPCSGDIDGTNDVGFGDLLAVLASWGPCAGCPADLNGDGEVGFADLLLVLSTWGAC